MAHDIFISHSSKDKPIADGICANLEAAGLRCWIAPRDISAGEEWPKAITNAIAQSRVMVLVFSANSNASSDVGREIVLAASNNLVIIPFKIENIEPEAGKKYYLAQTHWLEAMNPPTKAQIKLLVERVKAIVTPLDTDAIVQPVQSPQPAIGQTSTPAPANKPGWFRRAYLWIGIPLLLIILAISFWPMFQGMTVQPTATDTALVTVTATKAALPTVTTTKVILPKVTSTKTATPTIKPIPTTQSRLLDGMAMVFVPAGDFIMGSDSGNSDEQPVQKVNLKAFWIDQTEVTNAMYALCVKSTACKGLTEISSNLHKDYYSNPDYADYPVLNVSWFDAYNYCRWTGGRLPSEAEWEKAARGGLEGKQYPWGDGPPTCLNGALSGAQMDDCRSDDTKRVASFGANGYGLYDMAGNVYEWTNSLYEPYPYLTTDGREDRYANPDNSPRVARGGSWSHGGYYLYVTNRSSESPNVRWDALGFRCISNIQP